MIANDNLRTATDLPVHYNVAMNRAQETKRRICRLIFLSKTGASDKSGQNILTR